MYAVHQLHLSDRADQSAEASRVYDCPMTGIIPRDGVTQLVVVIVVLSVMWHYCGIVHHSIRVSGNLKSVSSK